MRELQAELTRLEVMGANVENLINQARTEVKWKCVQCSLNVH
jgi:hypothetical protein